MTSTSAVKVDEFDSDLIDSPLFNRHNLQDDDTSSGSTFTLAETPEYLVTRHFSQEDCHDLDLPPATTDLPYAFSQTRRSVFAGGADVETLPEGDFPDSERDCHKPSDDVDRIVREIKAVVLFEGYDEDELLMVTDYMFVRSVNAGDVIIEQGTVGDAFYVVKSGCFQCDIPGDEHQPIRTYDGNGYFGELALINQAPRAATITASTPGELWVLSALRYSWLRKRRAMSNAEQFEGVIKSIPLFRNNLNPSLINKLIDAIEVVNLTSGDVICKQGQPGDSMYFIIEGQIEVTINSNLVKTMNKNEFFGERALILDEGRAATCRAVAKSKLAMLPKESFGLLIPDNIIAKMKRHIALSYNSIINRDNSDDFTEDDLSTTSVYMEYFCHDVNK